jgi:hypothetical protein
MKQNKRVLINTSCFPSPFTPPRLLSLFVFPLTWIISCLLIEKRKQAKEKKKKKTTIRIDGVIVQWLRLSPSRHELRAYYGKYVQSAVRMICASIKQSIGLVSEIHERESALIPLLTTYRLWAAHSSNMHDSKYHVTRQCCERHVEKMIFLPENWSITSNNWFLMWTTIESRMTISSWYRSISIIFDYDCRWQTRQSG